MVESKLHLHRDLEHICLENIQTCILLGNLSAASMQSSSEALYLGIAIRIAEILRFNVPHRSDTVVMQELKRRIWWSLFMFDHWCSAGNAVLLKMRNFDKAIDLPMDESVFQSLEMDQMTKPTLSKPDIWAHMITLVEIFGRIQDLNQRCAHANANASATENAVASLALSLNDWEASLPPDMRYNRINLDRFRGRSLGGPFISLHQAFYHYGTVLFYQYLDVNQASTPRSAEFAGRCKRLAISQSALLKTARELGDCDLLYPGVGHSAVISSSVLLHTLLFGDEIEHDTSWAYLGSNIEILKELRRYWPSVERTVSCLTIFQEGCLQKGAPQAYTFSKWVSRFLFEYQLPLDEAIV
ncbi:hypothetical protein H2198_002984 [Neophaeococcomyces mojaviensis]|uniref:Uncharacterized protein n=1 Tax=Neophaeococcomyces mojaviensis TaxID=3383035 RepID=A0ACC3ACV5_9EURO|nr:hypothetical protein H2198_002984 [Knufia sp. JES_112]